jgi:hypothetical protein
MFCSLPSLRFFRAFSSVVRQIPGYTTQRGGTARTLPWVNCIVLCIVLCRLCCSVYCLCVNVYCTVLYCTVLLPPGVNPIAVKIYHIISRMYKCVIHGVCLLLDGSWRFGTAQFHHIQGQVALFDCCLETVDPPQCRWPFASWNGVALLKSHIFSLYTLDEPSEICHAKNWDCVF